MQVSGLITSIAYEVVFLLKPDVNVVLASKGTG